MSVIKGIGYGSSHDWAGMYSNGDAVDYVCTACGARFRHKRADTRDVFDAIRKADVQDQCPAVASDNSQTSHADDTTTSGIDLGAANTQAPEPAFTSGGGESGGAGAGDSWDSGSSGDSASSGSSDSGSSSSDGGSSGGGSD